MLVGDVGCDHLEQSVAEPAQGFRVEVTGLPQQVGLRLRTELGVEIGRQLIQCLDQGRRSVPR